MQNLLDIYQVYSLAEAAPKGKITALFLNYFLSHFSIDLCKPISGQDKPSSSNTIERLKHNPNIQGEIIRNNIIIPRQNNSCIIRFFGF